jgi:dolichyl-phosphate beta-glucosyltransferase
MVLPGIQDTQCGFKMFTADAARAVLPTTAIEGWSFDVELLASARAQGWRIREVPIEWHYGQASRLRVLPHSFEMLRDLFHIRGKVRRGAFARPATITPPEPPA